LIGFVELPTNSAPTAYELEPVPPFDTTRVPPIVNVPDVVIAPPERVRPVEPPEPETDVTVPSPSVDVDVHKVDVPVLFNICPSVPEAFVLS
jgi:hypothetical protein